MIEVFCDGSVKFVDYTNSPGSWAFVVIKDGVIIHEEKEYVPKGATNDRTELTAFLRALEWVVKEKPDDEVTIVSDSQIVVKGFNGEWGRKANKDLWETIMTLKQVVYDTLIQPLQAKWVKGHSGNEWNEYVDKLCTSCYPVVGKPERTGDDRKLKGHISLLREILQSLKTIPKTDVVSTYFGNTEDIWLEIEKHLNKTQ